MADPSELLETGLEHHRGGRLAEAEAVYRDVLANDPENPDALHMLGVIAYQTGRADLAVEMIGGAIAKKPESASCHSNLGLALDALGRAGDAVESFRRALELDPDAADAHSNLGNALRALHQPGEAAEHCRRAAELAPDFSGAHYNLGLALMEMGETADALAAFRRVLEIEPAHVQCHYLVKALAGEDCDSIPPEFVRELFDTHAGEFDRHLRDRLAYRMPEALRDAIVEETGDGAGRTVYDLGCGTGLCGPLLRPLAARLVGSDLSPRMIEKAGERGVYDETRVEDLLDTLASAAGEADLVIAADVFVYLGNLEPVFAATVKALRPGGHFAFSTEDGDGDGFTLLSSARFAHSEAYVRGLAGGHGFTVLRARAETIRKERGQPVDGHLYVLRLEPQGGGAAPETP